MAGFSTHGSAARAWAFPFNHRMRCSVHLTATLVWPLRCSTALANTIIARSSGIPVEVYVPPLGILPETADTRNERRFHVLATTLRLRWWDERLGDRGSLGGMIDVAKNLGAIRE